MSDIKGRVKTIIMDKLTVTDQADLFDDFGLDQSNMQAFIDGINNEFQMSITESDINANRTFGNLCTFIENNSGN